MRLYFPFFLLTCCVMVGCHSRNDTHSTIKIGDPVPSLRDGEWLKGEPVPNFEKGKVYVLEFWATWCKPCRAAMPHLSALAHEYKDKVTIIGIDVLEEKKTSLQEVKGFVDSMGPQMDYTVATADSNMVKIVNHIMMEDAAGIPRTFVVNAEGKLAWIGHPMNLHKVLPKIVSNTWNIQEAFDKRNFDKYLRELDDSLNYELLKYIDDEFNPEDVAMPDSALLAIDEMVRKEPKLKYAPHIAYNTFNSLLRTNQHQAYEYGKAAISTPTYEDPAYDMIIGCIESLSLKFNFSKEIYQLCAEAYELKIKAYSYPEIVKIPLYYNNLAGWYWRLKNKSKAMDAQEKAIEELKSRKDYSRNDLDAYEARLRKYRNG